MNFTLHLTADCNFACRYCYETHRPGRMDERVALAACDLAFSFGHIKNGFSLFGGEPLLCRDLIEKVFRRCAELNAQRKGELAYKLTTNGSLLDEDFIKLANENNCEIALSHDGLLQDEQRLTRGGAGTAELLEPKIDLLLKHQPNALAMMTLLPRNAGRLFDSVKWLHERGFARVNLAIDYRPDAEWDDDSMAELDRQYERIALYCAEHYDEIKPLRFLNFESKVAAYVNDRPCIECRLGVKQPSIAPDGTIYPCNQFLNLPDYAMGSVFSGIDAKAQKRIYRASLAPEKSCEGCAIEKRCRHHCACLNFSMTGDMHTVPAVQCVHERSVIKNADLMAGLLYERKSERFMRAYGETAVNSK
jgi:uncharacterized protein